MGPAQGMKKRIEGEIAVWMQYMCLYCVFVFCDPRSIPSSYHLTDHPCTELLKRQRQPSLRRPKV